MKQHVYPQTLAGIGILASALDEMAQQTEEVGFNIGAVPIISTTSGEQIATIVFDNDQHAVVEI